MQIFNELKSRGVQEVGFISKDGGLELEEGAKAIFPEVPSAVRKIMYTTNAIEAVNSSFRKVTKRGAFPNDNSVFKLLYLRVVELQKKMGISPGR